jgi:hypothetical protein
VTVPDVLLFAPCGRPPGHDHHVRWQPSKGEPRVLDVVCNRGLWTEIAKRLLADYQVSLDGKPPEMTPFEAWAWVARYDPRSLPPDEPQIG